jgi:transcriptional regulator with XRE-family HTH domain
MIGRKIQAAREARGIKQAELARQCGMERQALWKLERAENVTVRTLERVAAALGVSVTDLVGDKEKPEEMT